MHLNTAGSKVPAVWAIFAIMMWNSACTFQGHSGFYVPFPIHLFIKRVSHCTGPTYFRLNNLITSLQLLQATQSMTFKSNGRMILMAAILGHSTH